MAASTDVGTMEKAEAGIMRPFDLRTVERELRDLWKEEEEPGNPKQLKMRACVLNLLVYEEVTTDLGQLNEMIAEVTKHHPCRVLLMSARPNSLNDAIYAEVSGVYQHVPGRGKQLASEQVTILAEGDAVNRLPTTAMPLLVPDLPVVLWWRGVPMEAQPFHGLLTASHRIILDTSCMPRPTAFLDVLDTMVRRHSDEVAFSDLCWSRLTQLRSHTAGLFDVPDLLHYLSDLSKVTIEYPASTADKELPSPQAMLLLGWFASCLEWGASPEVFQSKSGAHVFKFEAGEREVTADLVPVESMKEDNLKLTLTMTDSSGWQEARILINRNYGNSTIETKLETPTICWLKEMARYELPSESEFIGRELEILGHDTVYEGALEFAGQLLEKM